MPEDGLEAVCEEISGLDLADFFDASVRGTGELPLKKLLGSCGIKYQLRQASGSDDKGGKPGKTSDTPEPWLGASLLQRDSRSVFIAVYNGGPAELAGVAPGDIAVALDGIALTAANCNGRLRTYRDKDTLELVVFRGDELLSMKVKLEMAPKNTCYLQIKPDADEKAVSRRNAWLHVN